MSSESVQNIFLKHHSLDAIFGHNVNICKALSQSQNLSRCAQILPVCYAHLDKKAAFSGPENYLSLGII